MASTSVVYMAMTPLACSSTQKQLKTLTSFFNPLLRRSSSSKTLLPKPTSRLVVKSSFKEKAVTAATAATAAALTASMAVPDIAEAASGVSPTLKNFLLSIAAGGVVAFAIVGAVIAVANFDPVKRR